MGELAQRLLFVVEDCFRIRGRGLVLLPGVPGPGDRTSGRVAIERPDGSRVEATASPESFDGYTSAEAVKRWMEGPWPICVDLPPDDVPLGSKVWLLLASAD